MSKEITDYDRELGNRIEEIRIRHGLRQLDMALIMKTDVGMYKRYVYATRKIPAEKIALLTDELQLDLHYVMYGRDTSTFDFVKFVGTADFDEISKMFLEVSKTLKDKANTIAKLKKENSDKGNPNTDKSIIVL